jgi:hypothetical protein
MTTSRERGGQPQWPDAGPRRCMQVPEPASRPEGPAADSTRGVRPDDRAPEPDDACQGSRSETIGCHRARSRDLGLVIIFDGPVGTVRDPGGPEGRLLIRAETKVFVHELQHDTNALSFERRTRAGIQVDGASVNATGERIHEATIARACFPNGNQPSVFCARSALMSPTQPREAGFQVDGEEIVDRRIAAKIPHRD